MAELKNKMIGIYFHTINHANQVFLKVICFGLVDAPVICILYSTGKLTNPKSKSKVQVQVLADDWVFIKIRFSNHPVTQPPDQPPGKVSKKQDRAILPK